MHLKTRHQYALENAMSICARKRNITTRLKTRLAGDLERVEALRAGKAFVRSKEIIVEIGSSLIITKVAPTLVGEAGEDTEACVGVDDEPELVLASGFGFLGEAFLGDVLVEREDEIWGAVDGWEALGEVLRPNRFSDQPNKSDMLYDERTSRVPSSQPASPTANAPTSPVHADVRVALPPAFALNDLRVCAKAVDQESGWMGRRGGRMQDRLTAESAG
ncbi:hypothetical protein BDZ89DRAFT_1044083 [Hymenopellis radicata]|nr:hypothetical protein BDZ89DRAFT_1044083 [Hymenopellis radicata]